MKMICKILFPFFLLMVADCRAQNFDIDVVRDLNHNGSSFKNDYSHSISTSVNPVSVGAPVITFAVGLIKKDKKLQYDGICMAGAFITSSIIVQGTKRIIDRQRPFEKYSDIIKRDDGGGGSFPSGHTSSAFCTATSLSLRYSKWYVIIPSYTWAVSAGWARMYEGVHYPSDVFVGAVVGAGSAWLAHHLQKKLEKRNKNKISSIKL